MIATLGTAAVLHVSRHRGVGHRGELPRASVEIVEELRQEFFDACRRTQGAQVIRHLVAAREHLDGESEDAEVDGSTDAGQESVDDFAPAWDRVMNLDRFDLD